MADLAEYMFVAGVDGCRAGWVWFRVDVPSLATSVEVADLPQRLRDRPDGLASIAIDIPIGLLDGTRACDTAARKLLGQPRGSSVFPSPCRATIQVASYGDACDANQLYTGRKISRQTWGIAPKIKQVDDAITTECQEWVFEVHPEVSFWAMNGGRPMRYGKKSRDGRLERLALLRRVFPSIDAHVAQRPARVGADDLLDAAAAAWSARRKWQGIAGQVCDAEQNERGLVATIHY